MQHSPTVGIGGVGSGRTPKPGWQVRALCARSPQQNTTLTPFPCRKRVPVDESIYAKFSSRTFSKS